MVGYKDRTENAWRSNQVTRRIPEDHFNKIPRRSGSLEAEIYIYKKIMLIQPSLHMYTAIH